MCHFLDRVSQFRSSKLRRCGRHPQQRAEPAIIRCIEHVAEDRRVCRELFIALYEAQCLIFDRFPRRETYYPKNPRWAPSLDAAPPIRGEIPRAGPSSGPRTGSASGLPEGAEDRNRGPSSALAARGACSSPRRTGRARSDVATVGIAPSRTARASAPAYARVPPPDPERGDGARPLQSNMPHRACGQRIHPRTG
jgi:hypothetical protein